MHTRKHTRSHTHAPTTNLIAFIVDPKEQDAKAYKDGLQDWRSDTFIRFLEKIFFTTR